MSSVEIERTLKTLRLPGIRATLESRLILAQNNGLPFLEVFSLLLEDEMNRRRSKLIERRIALSGLQARRDLSDFDWAFNPKIPKALVLELVKLKFVDEREDAMLIGSPGTGKSHIAQAIAHAALLAGLRVFYREANTLFGDLMKARAMGNHRKLLAQIENSDLVVLDDLFLRKLPDGAAEDLIEIIMGRYAKTATLITSNRPIEDWGKMLGDPVAMAPILDRLFHRSHLIRFEGKSYRLHAAARRQLASAPVSR